MSWSDPGRWSVDKCLVRVAELEAAKTRIQARQAELLARLIEYPDPICANVISRNPAVNRAQIEQRSLTAEVACSLHLSHDPGWHTERLPDGTTRWTTPSGRIHDKPLDQLPMDTTRDTRPPPRPRPPTPDEPPF